MAAKRTWSDLDEKTRKLIITVAVADGILKVAALIDIKRRPASQIRGPRWLWAPVVAVVNSAGVVPISYFVFGRRQPAVTIRLTSNAAREMTASIVYDTGLSVAHKAAALPRAIGGPLTPVSQGPRRSLAVHRLPRSGRSGTQICRIPKLIVRVRFPSPAPYAELPAQATYGP